MSLRKKTLNGFIWTFSQQFGIQFISFLITIVLARILGPSEFGIIAMLSIFIAVGGLLVNGGLSSSIIRTPKANQRDYSTVFYFNLFGSIVIYACVYALAPFIAAFYKQEVLTQVLRVYSIVFIINAFYEIQSARLVKIMDFKTQAFIQVPSVLISGLIGVLLAMNGFRVWSLVWMHISSSLLVSILHWIFSNWRPSLIFDFNSFKKHFHFGYKMTLSGLIDIIYKNIYVLIIGKNYSAVQLGYYSRADSISQLPTNNIFNVINTVTYPMFATISDDDIRLKMIYKKLVQQVIYWNASILILLIIIAEPLFNFLLTEKWLPAVPYFQILCLAGILHPLHAYNHNILKVKGRSDLILKLEFIKKFIAISGILLIIPFGIYGLLYFQLAFSILSCFINSYYSGILINYSIKEQLKDIGPTIFLCILTGISCFLLESFLKSFLIISDLERLIFNSLVFYTLYMTSSYLMQFNAISDFKHLILKR